MVIWIGLAAAIGVGGLATWLQARRAARLAAKRLRKLTGTTGRISRTLGVGVLVCAAELVVAEYTHDWRVLLTVFALPALCAGNTVARVFALAEFARGEI